MRHFRSSYVVIPLLTLTVAAVGSLITNFGMSWYRTLALPSWTPPGEAIGMVWTVIYILTALTVIVVWTHLPRDRRFWTAIGLFVVNVVLHVAWTYVFFAGHNIAAAVDVAFLLFVSVIALTITLWPRSHFAARLLVPYALWTGFATYLSFAVWQLNR